MTCADPGIFVRAFQVSLTIKSSDSVFYVLSSAYLTEVKWSISRKSIIFQDSRGGPTFSRGIQLFPGGGGGGFNCLFPIETHITCDFPRGGLDPYPPPPPLDPHLNEQETNILNVSPGAY